MQDDPILIGSRVEMLVDDYLVAECSGAGLRLAVPQPREIALRMEKPWEGFASGIYSCVFHDGEKYRMYYRGTSFRDLQDTFNDRLDTQFNCMAVSDDGIHWERPNLGVVEFEGSTDNNVIFNGMMAHNFSPMLDPRPECPEDERFKAVAGHAPQGLMAYKSADGVHWTPLQDEPVITNGAFDSHNLCFFDARIGQFRCYSRCFVEPRYTQKNFSGGRVRPTVMHGHTGGTGSREIQSCTSADFIHWTEPEANQYNEDAPQNQFYTNATTLCPGAPHFYLSFPMRFMAERMKVFEHHDVGVSDAVMMSSRDGVSFDRTFPEAWIRPNLDRRNWTQRNFITACGILETSPEEFSLYVCEHYEWDDAYIRRYTVRRHGFASMYAPYAGGSFTTKPLIFAGSKLFINYATSAAGHVRVTVTGRDGSAASGIIYGNELEHRVVWETGSLESLQGKPVQVRFELKDADLFSFRFGD